MYIDWIIITVCLTTILAVGLYGSKGVATFKDYAVGNRHMSTFVLTASLIATVYGGGFLTTRLNAHYHNGLYTLMRDLVFPIGFYITARLMIVRMKSFIGHLSIAESMGMLYGQTIRIITAIFGVLMAISIVAIQFKVGLSIAPIVFPTIKNGSMLWAIILSCIVIVYASFGGAKSVTFTDVYQFFLFFVCLPIIILILLYHTSHPWDAWQALIQIPKFNPIKVFTWHNIGHTLSSYATLILFPINPSLIQRMYMSTSVQHATKVFCNTAAIRILFSILACMVAIMLHIGGHILPPGQQVLDYIIGLDYFLGIKGFLVSAIIALLMSTADSDLHIASVLCTNDLFPFLFKKFSGLRKASLKTARITAATIGLLSLLTALYTTSIIQLLNKAALFYTSTITVPFIIACFGFRPRSATVLCTMGISTTLTAYTIFIKGEVIEQYDIFKSVIMNTFILFTLHYLLPKRAHTGWVGIADDSPVQLQNQKIKRWWLRKIKYIQSIFTKYYWSSIFPKNISTFIGFGIYLIIYSSISLLYIQKTYLYLYIYWYIALMAIGTLITFYPAWHSYYKGGHAFLDGLWPILLYMVLFVSAFTFATLSHFAPISCALIIANIALSTLLLPLPIVIMMLAIVLATNRGMIAGLPLQVIWLNRTVTTLEWVSAVTIACVALISCLTYRYARRKIQLKCQIIELTRNYERDIILTSMHNQANWNRLDPTYNGKILQEIADTLEPDIECVDAQKKKLYALSRILLQRAKEERTLTLDPESLQQVDIDAVIFKAYETVRDLSKPLQLLVKKQTKATHILAASALIERCFTINFWEICQSKQATDHIITLTIADTLLAYHAHKHNQLAIDNIKPLSHPLLPALAFCISTDTATPNLLPTYVITDEVIAAYLPKETHSLYQVESRQIVQAHGGYTAITETAESLTFLYVLPLCGKKVMRLKRHHMEDLFQEVAETVESLAQEKELIHLLVKETTLTQEKIEQTLAFIKQAHGIATRESGDPYYTHPMAVTKLTLEVTKDPTTLLAALLHDTVEDTAVTLDQIELLYGSEIAYIVGMVTHYTTQGYRRKLDRSERYLSLYKCNDIRVMHIKLADRLHNLRTLSVRKYKAQLKVAQETVTFYIPWAKQNNMVNWIPEMEALCHQILSSLK
ncbi:sodium:solute symporter family protein [Candidatus Cardinium sp. TP]|uniref:sodium:solute symporter family protein n=1 Tax=Candidatus Cardinium sp. TP TaxID=2961955 RepID=UPI0021AEFE95|nr:HD domain-containing protein [Candidatus Cardinium sp. TP]MCT4696936.1 HD domain-containing protein [Candidatus Cardinium sp. TP]